MKARTFLIMTGATFALAAPAAQANLERVTPAKHPVAHHKIVAKKVAAKTSKSHTATAPRYIHFAGSTGQLSTDAGYTDQQLCEDWAMNCDTVGTSSASDPSPAESAPVASPASETSSTELASVDSSVSDNSSASDDNSLLCPGGGVWDEEYPYCV
jgi:hypothetical protein